MVCDKFKHGGSTAKWRPRTMILNPFMFCRMLELLPLPGVELADSSVDTESSSDVK